MEVNSLGKLEINRQKTFLLADIKVHFLGAEIGNPLSMKQLLAGIRSSQALMAWFDSQGIRFIEKNDTFGFPPMHTEKNWHPKEPSTRCRK